jgi:hypothetical protein
MTGRINKSGIAVDVALIPPPEIGRIAAAINRSMIGRTGLRNIVLGTNRCVPHISLGMAAISCDDLDAVLRCCEELCRIHLPIRLTIPAISVVETEDGDIVTGFDIEPTPELKKLHTSVLDVLLPISLEEPESGMLLRVEGGVKDSGYILDYIANFAEKAGYKRFSPHITLAYGEIAGERELVSLPMKCCCTTLAVCHIGDFGVCRECLASYRSQ